MFFYFLRIITVLYIKVLCNNGFNTVINIFTVINKGESVIKTGYLVIKNNKKVIIKGKHGIDFILFD